MTAVFLVLLAAAWVAVFFPAAMRAKQSAPFSTAERFRRRMDLIAPRQISGGGRYVVVPESGERLTRYSQRRAQQRRIRVLVILLGSVPLSFLVAWTTGIWAIHIAMWFSLGLYCVLLVEAKRRRDERSKKVRSMVTRRRQAAAARQAAARQTARRRAVGDRRG